MHEHGSGETETWWSVSGSDGHGSNGHGEHGVRTALREVSELPGPTRADIIVVGAGIAGLSVAYELLSVGMSVIVVDKESAVGLGETGRSTAHLSNALDDRYVLLERVHGSEGAKRAAESHRAGIERIQEIIELEGIECGFERVDGYLFEHGPEASDLIEHELAAALRAGLHVEMLSDFPALGSKPVLRFFGQAQLDPLAYVRGLARAVRRLGGHIYTSCHVRGIEREQAGHVVRMEDGLVLSGNDVVVATNSPIHDVFAIHTKQAAYRSYVVAFAAADLAIPRALYWDTADPYHYVRFSGNTLLVGGADHRVGQARHPEACWDELEAWARKHFHALGEVSARWSGQIMEPNDGLAFIGKNPAFGDRTYIVTGDSGNGMTHAALAGLLLRDLILGAPSPWARLYDPARIPKKLPSIKEYLLENAKVAVAYTDWIKPAHGKHHAIARGHGEVIQRGLHKLAVYVDAEGERHECSAICPHLGGVVRWNAAEHSWDCPCHGSRFDPYGRVLAGPANRGLTLRTESPRKDEPSVRAR